MAGKRKEIYIQEDTLPYFEKLEKMANKKNSVNNLVNQAIVEFVNNQKE